MKKKNKNVFSDINNAAIGIAGLGVTTAVGAGISSKTPAGYPTMTEGYSTLAGFVPIAATATIGNSLIKTMKRKRKY